MVDAEDRRAASVRRAAIRQQGMTALLLALASILAVVPAASGYQRVSVYDEATHIDYTTRLAHGDLVRRGQTMRPDVLNAWACRGFFVDSEDFPQCGLDRYDPETFPARGIDYNEFHPPVYYGITAAGSRVLLAATPVSDFVLAERLMGTVWLAAGMWTIYALARSLGCGVGIARCAAMSVALLPAVVLQSSTVTNDAAALFAGGLMMFVVMRCARGNPSPVACLAAGAVAASLKVVFGLTAVVGLVVLLGAAWWSRRERREAMRLVRCALALGLGVMVVYVGWGAVQSARALPGEYVNPVRGINGVEATGIPFVHLLDKWVELLAPTDGDFIVDGASNLLSRAWQTASTWVLALMPSAAAVLPRLGRTGRMMAIATAIASALGGVIVALQFFVSDGDYPRFVSSRYGLCLVPGFVACAALLAQRSRPIRVGLAGLLIAGAVIMVPSYVWMAASS